MQAPEIAHAEAATFFDKQEANRDENPGHAYRYHHSVANAFPQPFTQRSGNGNPHFSARTARRDVLINKQLREPGNLFISHPS